MLVTGAASGLGAALVAAFRARGDEVLATDRVDASSVEGGIDLVLDITSDDDWAAAVDAVRERWGGLDVLVNNAGVAGGGRVDRCTLEEWQWITDINLFGAGPRHPGVRADAQGAARPVTWSTSPRSPGSCTRAGWAPTTR